MNITVLKSKLAYVKITQTELFYEGSITIDSEWMAMADIRPNEQVHVVNVNNGDRLITYAISGEAGSKMICLNGPAARNGMVGDEIVIITYAEVNSEDSPVIPTVVSLKGKL